MTSLHSSQHAIVAAGVGSLGTGLTLGLLMPGRFGVLGVVTGVVAVANGYSKAFSP